MWWPTLFAGKSLVFGDSVIHGLPLLHFFKDYLHGGESPLWVKEIYGGHPLFAEGQGAFAEPLNLFIAWAFPPILGNNVFHYFCMLASGAGVIRLCRIMGCSMWSAGFAALAVVFSGFWIYLQHNLTVSGALMWAPWAFVAFESWLRKPVVSRAIWMALAGTMLILAGYPQVIHGVMIFALCSLVAMPFSEAGRLLWKQHRRALLGTGALAAILCLGLSAFQLLPLMELAGLSHRSGGTGIVFQKLVVYYVRGMVFPLDERSQVPAAASLLVCMLASLSIAIRSSWRAKGYLIGTIMLVMLGVGGDLWPFRWLYRAHLIPGLHFFRIMQIYLTIGIVGMAVLAAFAIDGLKSWLSEHADPRKWKVVIGLGVLLLYVVWFAIVDWANPGGQAWFPLLVVTLALLSATGLAVARRTQLIPAAMFMLMLVQCGFSVHHLKFYDATLLKTPSVLDGLPRGRTNDGKFFTVSIAGVYGLVDSRWPNLGSMAQRAVASNLGLSNLLRGDSSLDGALALQLHNRDILTPTMTGEVHGISQASPGSRMIDILNVRYITADSELHAPGLRVVGHDPLGFWVMENTLVRPFVQVYTHAIGAQSADDSLSRLRVMQSPTLVVQTAPGGVSVPPDDPSPGNAASVEMDVGSHRRNHYILDVQSHSACWIFLADANYPGWYATVDGVPATVWTAQVLGKAVHVPAGRHRVEVGFRSASFRMGVVISMLSLLVATALLIFRGRMPWRRRICPGV